MKLGLGSTKCGSWYPRENDSTVTRSPPTSRTSDARSSVVVATRSAASTGAGDSVAMARASAVNVFMSTS